MFKFYVDVQVLVDGCPESGLDAVKFREENGLQAAPTNQFDLKFEVKSRELAERFANRLDKDADLKINYCDNCRHMKVPPALLKDDARLELVAFLVQEHGRIEDEREEGAIQETINKPASDFIVLRYGEPVINKMLKLDHPRCAAKLAEVNALLAEMLKQRAEERARNEAEAKVNKEEQAKQEAEAVRVEAEFEAKLWAHIEQFGDENQKERKARNLLGKEEAVAWLTDLLFAPLCAWSRYKRMSASDVCTCETYDGSSCSVDFETLSGDDVKLNAEQFDTLKDIENLMPDDATVSPRMHVGTSEECDNRVERCGYSVTVTWGGKKFTREYMA